MQGTLCTFHLETWEDLLVISQNQRGQPQWTIQGDHKEHHFHHSELFSLDGPLLQHLVQGEHHTAQMLNFVNMQILSQKHIIIGGKCKKT